jgi:hypothetical protein
MRGSYKPGQTVFDGPDDFDSWDRCITRGLPVSMLPRNYNNGIRIMQFPGYVVIVLEMAHETRIIPTTKHPPLDGSIRQYLGESRGRWEGNTLVVETVNFNGKTAMTNLGVPSSITATRCSSTPATKAIPPSAITSRPLVSNAQGRSSAEASAPPEEHVYDQ